MLDILEERSRATQMSPGWYATIVGGKKSFESWKGEQLDKEKCRLTFRQAKREPVESSGLGAS